MIDRLLALLETKKTTIAALLVALVLYFAESVPAHLVNSFGIPADWALRLVSLAKLFSTVMAAVGLTPVPQRAPKNE